MHYSLSQILNIVDQGFKTLFEEFDFWVVAEVSRANVIKNNVYLDLIETDHSNRILAKSRAIMRGSGDLYQFLRQTKLQTEDIKGLKLLMHGRCNFHQEYGFSIIIDELSSEYTLGQMQQKQKNILTDLQRAGLAEKNKQTNLGYPPFTIAVISGQNSQGLHDFETTLSLSQYAFFVERYYSAIHGNEAKLQVHQKLEEISADIQQGKKIDAVVILRGGGESTGILRQNDEHIAKSICLMPVPVCIAVGHTSDTSVLDHISRYVAKTPTDAAYLLIQVVEERATQLQDLRIQIQKSTQHKLESVRYKTDLLRNNIQQVTSNKYQQLQSNINHRYQGIVAMSPEKMHKLGYATLHDSEGKYLGHKKISGLQPGDQVTIKVYDQELQATIS